MDGIFIPNTSCRCFMRDSWRGKRIVLERSGAWDPSGPLCLVILLPIYLFSHWRDGSYSAILSNMAAIAFVHKVNGWLDPTEGFI